jgi:hypothetical protein
MYVFKLQKNKASIIHLLKKDIEAFFTFTKVGNITK